LEQIHQFVVNLANGDVFGSPGFTIQKAGSGNTAPGLQNAADSDPFRTGGASVSRYTLTVSRP
jgi:hypothetical protein